MIAKVCVYVPTIIIFNYTAIDKRVVLNHGKFTIPIFFCIKKTVKIFSDSKFKIS